MSRQNKALHLTGIPLSSIPAGERWRSFGIQPSKGHLYAYSVPSGGAHFLLRENHVLLLQRANTGYEDGNYSVVAGHLDGGESVTQAAIREAYEEVGVHLRSPDLTVAGVMHRLSNDERIDFFLVATTWSGSVTNQEPDKCSGLRGVPWMPSWRTRFPTCKRP